MRRTLGNRPSALALICIVLGGCSNRDEREDVGYSDGYAVGYNTACEIRATMIDGDFNNQHYAAAYARGQTDGIAGCHADRRGGRVE